MDVSTPSLCTIIESAATPEKFPQETHIFILTSHPRKSSECAMGSAQKSCVWDGKGGK